jgi:hypothetical protein
MTSSRRRGRWIEDQGRSQLRLQWYHIAGVAAAINADRARDLHERYRPACPQSPYPHCVIHDAIGRHIRSLVDDQFACSFDSTTLRKLHQSQDLGVDPLVEHDGGARIILFYEAENFVLHYISKTSPVRVRWRPTSTRKTAGRELNPLHAVFSPLLYLAFVKSRVLSRQGRSP